MELGKASFPPHFEEGAYYVPILGKICVGEEGCKFWIGNPVPSRCENLQDSSSYSPARGKTRAVELQRFLSDVSPLPSLPEKLLKNCSQGNKHVCLSLVLLFFPYLFFKSTAERSQRNIHVISNKQVFRPFSSCISIWGSPEVAGCGRGQSNGVAL